MTERIKKKIRVKHKTMKDEKTERHNKTRMITFIKSKFKKTDDKHVLRQLSNVKNVCKI